MIIKSIAALCKKSKKIQIYESDEVQFIGDGKAIYPLYNMPIVTDETIFTIFDIKEKQKVKMLCKVDPLPERYQVIDIDDQEHRVEESSLEISYSGYSLIPLKCSVGLVFIDAAYIKPLADYNSISYYERKIGDNNIVIAIKSGFIFLGMVMPVEVINEDFVKSMQDLTEECDIAFKNLELMEEHDEKAKMKQL